MYLKRVFVKVVYRKVNDSTLIIQILEDFFGKCRYNFDSDLESVKLGMTKKKVSVFA
jgi:hypothetical protein